MEQTPQPQTPPEPIGPVPPVIPVYDRALDVKNNKDIAALGYVWILSVFVYFYKGKSSTFISFHARQGMMLFALSILFWFVPGMLGRVLEIIVLGFCAMGFLAAAQSKWLELPLVFALSHGDIRGLRDSWKDAVKAIVRMWKMVRRKAGQKASAGAQSPVNQTPPSQTLL
jgi:uncharacterized membrane protein